MKSNKVFIVFFMIFDRVVLDGGVKVAFWCENDMMRIFVI